MSDQHSRKRHSRKQMKPLFSFYKRDGGDSTQTPAPASSNSVSVTPNQPNHLSIDEMEVIVETPNKPAIQTDPGLRDPICTFPVNQQDRIQKEYVKLGPCQPKLQNYPTTFDGRDNRRFQYRWFELFPWLEYSVAKDKSFCFPCFLFEKDPPRFPLFTTVGCCNWSRMLAGKKAVKYPGKEGLPFRGHDESCNSNSGGHFIEIIKSYADMNDEIVKVVL
ncbi:putative transcription factor and/or regulators TTF-type(Zn) family [Heracleum sosnowskyi]|uniref:Transcription factor and/or regulators TTF-type(Zn) family n=1 Tax=Heracleum sosnowskyi TaxID=360622 RepID=A0AAD8LYX3_9APIA|nr:putative transcription factor and/or regulators TTF-type(Zn) family [Heracleum sosnowskyi]